MAEVSGGVEMLDHLVAHYRNHLIATEFRAGCRCWQWPSRADPDNPDRTAPMIDRAAAAFDSWNGLIVEQLVSEGITKDRAHELAVVITASLEGRTGPCPGRAVCRSIGCGPSAAPCPTAGRKPEGN